MSDSDFSASSTIGSSKVALGSCSCWAPNGLSDLRINQQDCDIISSPTLLYEYIQELNRVACIISSSPNAVFGPGYALIVKPSDEWWCFRLASSNLCSLKLRRRVILFEARFNMKRNIQTSLAKQEQPLFLLYIRREHIINDAILQLSATPPSHFLKPLKVIFIGEEGVDAGGLKREFFSMITEKVLSPEYGMFEHLQNGRVVWFSRNSMDTDKEFWLVGVLLGLAVYNDVLLSLRFPRVLYRKLQSQVLDLDDLAELEPEMAKALADMLTWPESDKEGFKAAFDSMDFTIDYDYFGEKRNAELVPGGRNIPLIWERRFEYVEAYCDYQLTVAVAPMFEAFREGFMLFQTRLLLTLSAEELETLICGRPDFNFEELRAGATYEGYKADEPYIKEFWDALLSWDEDKKRQFLRFSTGSDNVPVGGLKELHLKIQLNGVDPTDRLPTAYTCFNVLLLPRYESKEKMLRLLLLAIQNAQGFGLK